MNAFTTVSLAAFSGGGGSLWEKIAEWYQGSLIHELLEYLSQTYFSVDFGTYEHFSVSGTSGGTVRNMILAIALGIIIAAVLTAYTREGLGGFVRRLIKEDALAPEKSKTLMELGYFRSTMLRRALSRGSALRMVVRCTEQEAFEANRAEQGTDAVGTADKPKAKIPFLKGTSEYRMDFTTARFYIPEDLRHRAEIRFDKKGSGWIPVIVISVVTVIAASALCFFLPDLLQFADNLIGIFSPKA